MIKIDARKRVIVMVKSTLSNETKTKTSNDCQSETTQCVMLAGRPTREEFCPLDEEPKHIFTLADFPFSHAEGDPTAGVLIVSRPQNGDLRLGSLILSAGDCVSVKRISNGELYYAPREDFSGDDDFAFAVSDGNCFSGQAIVLMHVPSTSEQPVTASLKIAAARVA